MAFVNPISGAGSGGGGQAIADAIKEYGTYHGVCETLSSTAAKVVNNVENFPEELEDGVSIRVRFENGLAENTDISLNVNGTGAKGVKAFGYLDGIGDMMNLILSACEIVFVYNSDYDIWVMVGSGFAWEAYESKYTNLILRESEDGNLLVPLFANVASSTTTVNFNSITNDIDYAYGTMTSINFSSAVITPNTGGRRMISLSFVSGATATAFTVPSAWYFVGDDCEDGDFVPAANMRYDVLIEYRNGVVRGYVSGYEVTA